MWCCTSVIPALKVQREEDHHEFEGSLVHIVSSRPASKTSPTKSPPKHQVESRVVTSRSRLTV